MKSLNLKVLAAGLALAVSFSTSLASAQRFDDRNDRGYNDRNDGYGRPGPGPGYGPGQGGNGWGRPRPRPRPQPPRPPQYPPQPPPQQYADLCAGRYVGYYSNGFQAVMDFSHGYGETLNVSMTLNGTPLSGTGYCRQWAGQAQFEFNVMGVINRGNIQNGYMSGNQPGGATFTATKQW